MRSRALSERRPRGFSELTMASLALTDIPTMEHLDSDTDTVENSEFDDRESSWTSLWISNIMQFVCGLSLSIYFTSMWPYLQSLDPQCKISFLGWVIASFSAGQAVASPLFGIWSQRTGSSRLPITVGLLLSAAGHCVYALLPAIGGPSRWIMLGCRIMVGLGSGNLSVLRSYTATASVPKDRQRAVALSIAAYVLGLTLGPAIQAAFTPIGSKGFTIGSVVMNMYTVPAFCMVAINLIAPIFLFTIFVEEYSGIIDTEKIQEDHIVVPKFDRIAAICCIYLWFTQNLISTNLEVMSAPVTIALYNWSDATSVLYNGILQVSSCFFSVTNYAAIAYTRIGKIDNRIQILYGLTLFSIFFFVFLPWPIYTGHLEYKPDPFNHTSNERGGCEPSYKWCANTKRFPLPMYIGFYILCFGMAFPYLGNSIGTLYSQILGPRKQGTMQGILALFGSIARCVGPLWATALFSATGYMWQSIITLIHLSIGFVLVIVFWRRMVPLKLEETTSKSSMQKDNPVFAVEA